MIRSYQLLGVASVLSLSAADESAIKLFEQDDVSTLFTPMIMNVHKAHALNLFNAASTYEQICGKETSITQMYRAIVCKNLRELASGTKVELETLCTDDEIQSSFKNACQQAKGTIHIGDRVDCWKLFIATLYTHRNDVLKSKIPGIWLAQKDERISEGQFMVNNAGIKLDESQKNYLIAAQIINFLPFALIRHHDPGAFDAFLEAREGK